MSTNLQEHSQRAMRAVFGASSGPDVIFVCLLYFTNLYNTELKEGECIQPSRKTFWREHEIHLLLWLPPPFSFQLPSSFAEQKCLILCQPHGFDVQDGLQAIGFPQFYHHIVHML